MPTLIQKPIEDIVEHLKHTGKVFVVGCANCAAKCHVGGEVETIEMAEQLERKGVKVAGWACPDSGKSLCKRSLTRKMLTEDHKTEVAHADSFLVLACERGIHTVEHIIEGVTVYAGCTEPQPKWRSLWLKIKGLFGAKTRG